MFILIIHNASARRNIVPRRCPAWRIRALMKSKSMNPAQCAFTAHLLRNVCSAIARRFFLACSKFDGTRSARGVCLAHLGDSTAHVWRTHSVNEDPWAYVAYLPRICDFFRTPVERGNHVCYMCTPCRRHEVRSALVTKWGNLSEWQICNIRTMFIAFWHLKNIYFISLCHPIRVTYMNICHPRVT